MSIPYKCAYKCADTASYKTREGTRGRYAATCVHVHPALVILDRACFLVVFWLLCQWRCGRAWSGRTKETKNQFLVACWLQKARHSPGKSRVGSTLHGGVITKRYEETRKRRMLGRSCETSRCTIECCVYGYYSRCL